MQLIFDSAELMSLSHTLEYVGDFNFRNQQIIDVKGIILEDNFSGVKPVWDSMSGMIQAANDYSEFIVNGVSLGSGILQSLSFDSNNDVRNKRYSASIALYQTGNLFNLSGSYFSGLSGLANQRIDLIESFEENFSFSPQENETLTYERNLDLKIISGIGTNPTNIAKSIANIIFSGSVNLPFINSFYPNFYLSSGNKYCKETYELVKGEYNFSETFNFQSSNPFIWTYNHVAEFGGTNSTVTEKGFFYGVDTNYYQTAKAAYNSNIGGAYSRCSAVYAVYMGSGCTLSSIPIEKQLTLNNFYGSLEYEIKFTDDPRNTGGCYWEKTIDINKNDDGTYSVSEDGSIQGLGKKTYNPNTQYTNALSCFSTISAGVSSRLSAAIQAYGPTSDTTIYLESSSFTDSDYNGTIDYKYQYTNNSAFNTSSSSIKYAEASYEDSPPIAIANKYGILNDSIVIAPTYKGNSELGTYSSNVRVVGIPGSTSLYTLLRYADNFVELPRGDDVFISDAKYSFTPKTSELELNVSYNYVDYRDIDDILL